MASDTHVSVEASGETVAEAKLHALRELELRAPNLDHEAVTFQVVEEGSRGILGVGYTPARVVASAPAPAASPSEPEDTSPAGRVHTLLARVVAAMDLDCEIEVSETEDGIVAVCEGDDLGLLIGKHGSTIDALQTLAGAVASQRSDERVNVVVDAAGYRDRRRRTLESLALRAADDARESGYPVELEPMPAAERRIVHERLKDLDGIETSSDGDEPQRFVVVSPI
ncbi:MAG: KH domain-containing protein [Actinobacteria bacterium]|uniref:Unannotated protein n=1 Tax=freshwater metagenome TaxID=449393 RepID=A0A6J6NE84_9ZZZZ|nr:KH domain-containing protein [Actinomycetota bacterium]